MEWVDIDQVERAVDLYAALMTDAAGTTGWAWAKEGTP